MGMAASQARFLQLTARKTNIEYMGQQINQERLALANESAGLFEKQLTMVPPTPPSSLDDTYYTPGYTFDDPADNIQKKIVWDTYPNLASEFVAGDVLITIDDSTVNDQTLTYGEWTEATLATYSNAEDAAGTGNFADVTIDSDFQTLLTGTFNITAPQSSDATQILFRAVTVQYDAYQPDGSYTTVERKSPAMLEFDVQGRLVNTVLLDQISTTDDLSGAGAADGIADITGATAVAVDSNNYIGTGNNLTYSPVFDEVAFDNDMNEYEYAKATYDYEIEQINLETSKIQKQDKSLELKLKQLDTEHNAIQTEMDAVQKVLTKNIESSFKTFS